MTVVPGFTVSSAGLKVKLSMRMAASSARTGLPISGLSEAAALPGVHVFHAGTGRAGADVVTAGGRVLTVSGLGQTLPRALEHAYAAARLIHFDGMHYRGDIGRTIREAV